MSYVDKMQLVWGLKFNKKKPSRGVSWDGKRLTSIAIKKQIVWDMSTYGNLLKLENLISEVLEHSLSSNV